MKICTDCNLREDKILAFNNKLTSAFNNKLLFFCKKCQYLRYIDNQRSSVKIVCPKCSAEKIITINS